MYEIFEELLRLKGVKTADVCRETGLKAPTFSDWKKGKSKPNIDKLILIANYFGVSVEYLRTGKEPEKKEKPPMPSYDKDTMEMIKLFSQLNKEQKNSIIAMMRSFALTN